MSSAIRNAFAIAMWCTLGSVVMADTPTAKLPDVTSPTKESEIKDLTPLLFAEPHVMEKHGEESGKHADAHEEDHEDHGLFGAVEYLLLRPRRGAFDFGIADPANDFIPGGKLESLNYELRSGVRASIGYRFKDSPWGVSMAYTFLRSSADRTLNAPTGGLIYPTLTRPGLTDEVGSAVAQSSLEYNVFDLEVGRRFHVDERLNVRAFGGVRFANIRQDFDVQYDRYDANVARVMTSSNFDGFGPLLGSEATLSVFRGFQLYARGSGALLTGKLVNPITETNNGGITQYASLDYRTRRVIPVMGMGIGGGWQHKNVSVRVGYEITNWFGLIDQPRFTNDFAVGKVTTRQSDLSLEGLFFQLGLKY